MPEKNFIEIGQASVVCFGATAIDVVTPAGSLSAAFNGDVQQMLGGQAANMAVAFARQGAGSVRLVSAVGDDAAGTWALGELRHVGVDVGQVQTISAPSLQMKIDLTPPVKVTCISDNHASKHLQPAKVDLTGVNLAIVHAAHGWDAMLDFMDQCQAANVPVLFNAAPTVLLRDVSPLAKARMIILNEQEAVDMCHRLGVDPAENRLHLARVLKTATGKDTVVTLAAAGAVAATGYDDWHVPARLTTVVDPTGAGDAFIGVFVASYVSGRTIEDCLRHATAAASLVCENPGAAASAPDAIAVSQALQQTPMARRISTTKAPTPRQHRPEKKR